VEGVGPADVLWAPWKAAHPRLGNVADLCRESSEVSRSSESSGGEATETRMRRTRNQNFALDFRYAVASSLISRTDLENRMASLR